MSAKPRDKSPESYSLEPPKSKTFREFVHDKSDGTYFQRTPSSWVKIIIFYVIFYSILFFLFFICMWLFLHVLDESEPMYKHKESRIGTNPGIGFRPISEDFERGSVIQFNRKKTDESRYWTKLLDDFLKPYSKDDGENQETCTFDQAKKPETICKVDIESLGPCSPNSGYGFQDGKPCVLLKLNKIYGWLPECYNDTIPSDMPEDLKNYINGLQPEQRQQVWISCDGQHSESKEIIGKINFQGGRGFPAYFYPYLNQPGYVSPIVVIQFENPKLNQLISVECRAWAKNIIYSSHHDKRTGSLTFQLLID